MPFLSSCNDTVQNKASFGWIQDTDTGVYYLGPNSFGLATNNNVNLALNGERQVAIGTQDYREQLTVAGKVFCSNQVLVDQTSSNVPTFSFIGESNTGMYLREDHHLSFSVLGSEKLSLGVDSLLLSVPLQIGGQYLGVTATSNSPTYSFTDSSNTGVYLDASQKLALSVAGQEEVSVDNFRVLVNTNKLQTTNQNIAASSVSNVPMYSFTDSSNTGLNYDSASQLLEWSVAGVKTIDTSDSVVNIRKTTRAYDQIAVAEQSAAAPSYSFLTASNTGVYYNAGSVAVSLAGVEQLRVSQGSLVLPTGSIVLSNQVLSVPSASSAPAYSFNNATSTGMYLSSTCNLGLSLNGANRFQVTPTSTDVTGDFSVTGNLTVMGQTTTIATCNLVLTDNVITLNKDQTGTPYSGLTSGIEVERGDVSNYYIIFQESSTLFKIGEADNLQAVATRDDEMADYTYPFFDAESNKLTSDYTTKVSVARGADAIVFTSSDAERMRINSVGNVGINTLSPVHKLDVDGTGRYTNKVHVVGGAGSNGVLLSNDSTSWGLYLADNADTNADLSGTASASSNGTVVKAVRLRTDSANTTGLIVENAANSPLLSVRGSDGLTSIPGGNLVVGDTATDYKLDVNGTSRVRSVAYFASNVGIYTSNPTYPLEVNGNVFSSGNFISTSDRNAKYDITKISNALDKVEQLNGYTFFMKDDATKKLQMGVIAQECEPVVPEVVYKDENGKYTVSYGNFAGLFIECIKDLHAIVKAQQAEIESLKR